MAVAAAAAEVDSSAASVVVVVVLGGGSGTNKVGEGKKEERCGDRPSMLVVLLLRMHWREED